MSTPGLDLILALIVKNDMDNSAAMGVGALYGK